MSSRCLSVFLLCGMAAAAADHSALRVCSDPNNLPFSNRSEAGFENRIASLLAKDLHLPLQYTWFSEHESFIEHSLNENLCDLIIGVPYGIESARTTAPYYRSTYVFVSRKDRRLNVSSLLDNRLEKMRIGIHVAGDDYTPP